MANKQITAAALAKIVAPTGEPQFISGRNQGQIVLIGASVCPLVKGGFAAVGHTLDRSDRSTFVWEIGRGYPTAQLARADAVRISDNA